MDTKRICSGLCWCLAACLTVGAFVLVLAGITASAGAAWSSTGLVLIILAGAALAGMVMLMSAAFRAERDEGSDASGSQTPH
jgi:membrane protein implicated in regulation of membrane protease activity